jgi:hypothetical protein
MTMTLLETIRSAVTLVYGVVSTAFFFHGLRDLLRERRRRRACPTERPWFPCADALALPAPSTPGSTWRFFAPARTSFAGTAYLASSREREARTKGVRTCLMCENVLDGEATVCSARCAHLVKIWGGGD